jgi:hypothetical protein
MLLPQAGAGPVIPVVVDVIVVPVVSPALIEPPLSVTIGASVVPPVPVPCIIIVVEPIVVPVPPVAASSPEHAATAHSAKSQ